MKYYQACYGKPGNNWQLLNVSKDTPPAMAAFFENIGNGCTPQNIGTDVLLDANREPVILYEWISAENVICVLRAKYGERDHFGRPKMFAHGFMMPAEGALNDPSEILSIDDANFHYTDSETANAPSELICEPRLSLASAKSACGLEKKKWDALMKCVYAMLTSPTDYPLYIKCDGTMRTVKAAIYCILYALPISLRYQLSFSNADSLSYAKFKRIMFVDRVKNGDLYFDLADGSTNLSSELAEVEQYKERFLPYYAFVLYPETQFPMYCNKIQETLEQLSFGYISTIDEINLANNIANGSKALKDYSDEQLTKTLLGLLVSAPMQNLTADDYIADILNLFDNRAIVPNDTVMKRMALRNDKTPSEKYVEVYKKIRLRVLISKGIGEVVSFLNEQYGKSKSIFDEWYQLIIHIPNGKEAVYQFFKLKIQNCTSFEMLQKLLSDVRYYGKDTDLEQICIRQFFNVSQERILRASVRADDYESELNHFKAQAKELLGENNAEWIGKAETKIIAEFWKRFKFSEFEFEPRCFDNCWYLAAFTPHNPAIDLISEIVEAVEKYKKEQAEYYAVEKAVKKFKNENRLSDAEITALIPRVQKYVYSAMCRKDGSRHFCMWLELILLDRTVRNPIPKFVQLKLPVVCDSECFRAAFAESARMAEIRDYISEKLCAAVENAERYQIDPESVKTLKREIKIIDDYNKTLAAEEKQRQKDQRKQEKMKAQEQDDYEPLPQNAEERESESAHTKGSIFNNWFGGKKKQR